MPQPSDPATVLRQMLAMCAISYRGFNLIGPSSYKLARLREVFKADFERFSLVNGAVGEAWRVAWGPAARSLSGFGLDDVLIYVAEARDNPSKLAIVIRGTNPVSISDWVIGDFMFEQMVPWRFGENPPVDAKISASTALGLAIIRYLAWDENATDDPETTAGRAESLPSSIQEWAARVLASMAHGFQSEITNVIPDLANPSFNPIERLNPGRNQGQTLVEFLRKWRSGVANTAPQIYVTGHSKGGALSSTVALWLADTRADWDSGHGAEIHCYSFAGPTAGNEAFAKHSDTTLDPNCHRIWNTADVVPRAFVPSDMAPIPNNYGLNDLSKLAVRGIVDYVVQRARPLNYKQIVGPGTALNCPLKTGLAFPLQLAHQHFDAYLEYYGLDGELNSRVVLAPVL